MLLAFTAYDGYLRIYDFQQLIPILLIKSDFGGLDSLTFSKDKKLIAISGQDDCITIVNLITFAAFKLEAHKSFVNNCVFLNIDEIFSNKNAH